jgi:hypothetical protein
MSVIYPTFHCFDDAMEFCEQRAVARHPSVATTLRLVHGIVLVPDSQPAGYGGVEPGQPSVHAWVEDGDLVWDCGVLEDGRRVQFAVEKAEYYKHYRVQEATAYTMWQALEENRASGHFGPWRPKYRAMFTTQGTTDAERQGR